MIKTAPAGSHSDPTANKNKNDALAKLNSNPTVATTNAFKKADVNTVSSNLGPTLWYISYDVVLRLPMPPGVGLTVGTVKAEEELMPETEAAVADICTWMKDRGLAIKNFCSINSVKKKKQLNDRHKLKQRRRKIRFKNWLRRRNKNHDINTLVFLELKVEDAVSFKNFTRFCVNYFEHLLEKVKLHIERRDTIFHENICKC